MEKIKSWLGSENGMRLVNVLFLLSLALQRPYLLIVAFACWLVYLIWCIRRTESKIMRVIYILLALFVLATLAMYIMALLKAMGK